jgi:hypothetical protein
MEQRTAREADEAEDNPTHRGNGLLFRRRLAIVVAAVTFAMGAGAAAGCGDDKDGPVEDAGEAVDDAGDAAGEELEEADKEIGEDEK